jgi:hypothetical protein
MPTTINNTNNNTSNNNNSNNTVTINNVNISRDFLLSQKPIVLWIHDPGAAYNHDAVVNPELFPNFRDGQLLRIHCPRNGTPQTQQPQRGQGKQDQEKNNQEQKTEAKQDQTPSSDQEQQGHVEGSLERESVVVKGHVVDKESLSRQQQLQVI